jgi:hypothetical protein
MRNDAKQRFEDIVKKEYKKRTGRDTTVHFAKIADGASVEL